MEKTMIKLNDLSFGYLKDIKVLKNINLDISAGEKVGIIGANGVGKSTLLRLLTGLECEYDGENVVAGVPVSKKNLKEIRRHIGYVFQDSDAQLFLTTVKDNLEFGPANYGLSGSELESAIDNALNQAGIVHLKDKPVYMLSGGEKKLAAIATVLSMNPEILIFDEPTVALDPRNRRRIIDTINALDKTMVVASHDLDFILDTCDRVVLLYDHGIEKDASSESILTDKILLEKCGLELPLSMSRVASEV